MESSRTKKDNALSWIFRENPATQIGTLGFLKHYRKAYKKTNPTL